MLFLKKGHHSQEHQESPLSLDIIIKGFFMFLVGASFPKVEIGSIPMGITLGHVLILTILSNLGKCFTVLCYRKEASMKERLALGFAMFPRGEVGAAVLFIGLGFGLGGYANTLAMLSLALNLILTGLFVWIVISLLKIKRSA
jgi:Kef-type K+ transport system membrane component KefB